MATKMQAKPAELYEADFYVWAEEQAALLRARRFDALDLDNLIEEVEGLADAKLSAVLNGARVVMEHLSKLQSIRRLTLATLGEQACVSIGAVCRRI